MADELKPCPFCGADESYQCSRSATVGAATAWRCSKCGANGPYVERDGSDAALIRAWNRRAPSSAPAVDPREVCARPCDVLALNSIECECCEAMARACAAAIRALPPFRGLSDDRQPFAAQPSEAVKRLTEERDAARAALRESAAMCDTFAGEHGQRPVYTDATAAAIRAAKEASRG